VSTVYPPLSPAEARILGARLYGADRASDRQVGADRASDRPDTPDHATPALPIPAPILALTRSLGLSASDLLAFSASTAVAAALDTIRQTLATIDAMHPLCGRFHPLRTLAIDTLAAIVTTSGDPIERRRAASALLRAINAAPARPTATPAARPTPPVAPDEAPSDHPTPTPAHAAQVTPPPQIGPPPMVAGMSRPTGALTPASTSESLRIHPPTPADPAPSAQVPGGLAAISCTPEHSPPIPTRRHTPRAAILTAHAGAPIRPP